MLASSFQNLSVAIFVAIFVTCHSIPVQFKDAARTVEIGARDTITIDHGKDTSLLSRTSINVNRYRLIQLQLSSFILPPPVIVIPALAAQVHSYRGPQLYATLRNQVRRMWPLTTNPRAIRFAIGPFVFNIQTRRDLYIPLDFLERFCDTMEMWASNGFVALYSATLEDVETMQQISVALSLVDVSAQSQPTAVQQQGPPK
ncbi:MAG: hypothetical protein Q9178_001843 [Gyalolechia marmorata]